MAGAAVYKVAILPSCPNTIRLSVTHRQPTRKQYSLSSDSAVDMYTTSIANVKAEDQPATAAANTLGIDDGTDEAGHRTASTGKGSRSRSSSHTSEVSGGDFFVTRICS